MAHRFTVICEYKGGTYVKQLDAAGPVQAFGQWAEQFSQEEALTPGERQLFAGEIKYSLEEGNLVAMEGLQNVWYEGFSLEKDLLEVILVGMSGQPIPMDATESSRIPSAHM
ncbi:MAG: hypothetical protein IPH12_07620 [Saprospirales bacterium]|nr:hypothetical protein [Saprospirales bacterium]MBK8920714.1 hypothetical protein [Saprospirales bacterium]